MIVLFLFAVFSSCSFHPDYFEGKVVAVTSAVPVKRPMYADYTIWVQPLRGYWKHKKFLANTFSPFCERDTLEMGKHSMIRCKAYNGE